MASVVPSVASTKETTNYSRRCRLLVDICSQALRDTFDGIHAPENLHTVLASHPVRSTLQTLFKGKKKILNPGQWCKLYPAIASSVSSATFDITLLMVLLRNICGLRPPATGWGNLPSEDDESLEADIMRIKYFRNTVYALAGQASVNDATFNTHWQNMREVLVRLGGATYEVAIDTLKAECMDSVIEEHYKELLQQWKNDEYFIKEQLHEMGEDIKYIKEALRVALNKHGEEEVHPDESPNHREELPEVHLSTSGQESNTKHTKEKYGDSSALHGANQLYQDQRYRTVPQTGPLYHSDNPERSQHYLRMPQFGSPPYHDGTKERMDSPMTTSHSVSHHETVTPSHPTSQYSSERYAGSDTWGHAVFTQSITARPSDEVISDTNGNRSKSSSRTETRVSASGDARYANVQDISSYSGQKPFISNESDKRKSTKESARRHDDRDVKYGPAGTSSSEPMNVEQSENSRVSRNDATSLRNGMTGGTYGKTTVQSGITDLNAPLKHQLTIESNVRLAGKDSKQGSSTYSDHGKQPDSECITGAPEATGSRAGTTRGAQPPRLLYQLENNATTKEAASKSESIAADLKDHRAAKTEPKCLLPGLSWRTSAQKDQTPGTSSKNDPQNEISRESSFVKKGAGICELCLLSGTIICSNCRKTVCIKCMKIFATDLCETTKGQHVFVNMKDVKMPRKTSGNSKAYSSQESANASEACGDRETDWHCYRCTYLNPPGQRICVICATTRGISDVESAKPGSRVCRNCTLQNEETAVECIACHSLLTKNENYI